MSESDVARTVEASGAVTLSGVGWSMRFEPRPKNRVLFVTRGALAGISAPHFLAELERFVAQLGCLELFIDASEVTAYESPVRIEMVNFMRRHRADIVPRACVLTRGRLTAMGVAVAALALGDGRIEGTTDRTRFMAQLVR